MGPVKFFERRLKERRRLQMAEWECLLCKQYADPWTCRIVLEGLICNNCCKKEKNV